MAAWRGQTAISTMDKASEKPMKKIGSAQGSLHPAEASPTLWTRVKFWLPDFSWLSGALRDPDAWKLGIRVALALWGSFLLLIPDSSLRVMGNVAFFTVIATSLLAPNMPLQLYVMAIFTALVGICTGWAISCAAMASALRARNQVLLASQVQSVTQSIASESNPDQLYESALFHGAFLDPASSAVYGVYLAVFIYIFGLIKVKVPRLVFFSTFASIMLTAYCSYGPLIPTPNYKLVQSFPISGSCAFAIGLAATILVFPQSMSYLFGKTLIGVLGGIQQLVTLEGKMLGYPVHASHKWRGCQPKMAGLRMKLLSGLADIGAKTGMLELEISHGRLGPDDMKAIAGKLKALVFLSGGLRAFPELVASIKVADPAAKEQNAEVESSKEEKRETESDWHLADSIRSMTDLRHRADALEAAHGHRLMDLLPLCRDAASPLIVACQNALTSCIHWLHDINTRRWTSVDTRWLPQHEQYLIDLRTALEAFQFSGRKKVLAPFRSHFDAPDQPIKQKDGRLPYSPRALYAILAHQSNLTAFAYRCLELLELCAQLEGDRNRNRFWPPTGLRKLKRIVLDRRHDTTVPPGERNESQEGILLADRATDEEKQALLATQEIGPRVHLRDPDALPPSNLVHHFFRGLRNFLRWQTRSEGLYCLKYSLGTICLWMPSVFAHSAYFNYSNKGLWAIIMFQLVLQVYVSDQINVYIPRLLGTICGATTALVAWYCSTGSGHGNYYGLAIVTAVLSIPMGFIRANVPMQHFVVVAMFMATVALILGFSWIDSRLDAIGNVGVGASVFWRRMILVLVGLTSAFLVMLLPPQSSHTRVRRAAATSFIEILALYALLIEGLFEPDADLSPRYLTTFRARHLETDGHIQQLAMVTAMAHKETGVRGKWQGSQYTKLVQLEISLMEALQQLSGALEHLEPEWRSMILEQTPLLNPSLVTDVLAAATIHGRSLQWGRPIPKTSNQRLLDRLAVYSRQGAPRSIQLTWTLLEAPDFALFAKACIACYTFLDKMDDLMTLIEEVCGTVELPNLVRMVKKRG